MIYGYVRVSTDQQNGNRQEYAIKEYCQENGLELDSLFKDKVSGKNFDRPQYKALKNTAKTDDTIIVKELDRLGRNYEEIKTELAELKSRGVNVRIIDLPTFNVEDEALASLLNNLMIELLGYIAESERKKIQQRIQEGVNRAKAEGKPIGRPKRKIPASFKKYYKQWQAKEITATEFARLLEVSRPTLYRYIHEYEGREKSG